MKRYPGKFEGCAEQDIGEALYDLTMDGCCEDLGDVEGFGWFAVVDHAGRWFIVSEDSQGFFDYREFEAQAERDAEWNRIETEYAEYCETTEAEV